MKWIFILLLLLNIAYLGWELEQETVIHLQTSQSLPAIPISAKPLKLLDELSELPPPRQEGNGPQQLLALNGNNEINQQLKFEQMGMLKSLAVKEFGQDKKACFTYGPITEEYKVNELYDWLKRNDIQANKREEYDQQEVMFWIYLAATEDREQAAATLKELEQKGIKDYRLIRRGNFENAISLGLFSSKERVDMRLKELNTKGYKPVVVPYHESGVQRIFWVDVMFDHYSGDFDHILSGVPNEYDSVPIACNDIALAPLNP